jgi:thiol-disulfide isomerase/thioredoxin
VRVVPCVLLAACLCLGPGGCASFGKRSTSGDSGSAAGKTGPVRAAAPADPLVSHATTAELSGLLAGRVIDMTTGRPVEAYIRWECLDDKQEKAAPLDMSARGGYFTIEGLKPGHQYKLTARTKQGDRVLAGVSYVTAPNIHVLLKLSEDFTTPNTPPPPGPPGISEEKAPDKGLKKTGAAERPPSAWEPGVGQLAVPQPREANPFARPTPPQGSANEWQPAPAVQQPADLIAPGIAQHKDTSRPADPQVNIPPSHPNWDKPQQIPTPPAPRIPSGATPPSCSLLGNKLYDLALADLTGATWDWQANRRGKLVLLDFWFSTCPPCREAIYHLKGLQGQYGMAGLEVVGIACERDGTPQEQAYRVATLCQRLDTNYRLLLASGRHNPVPEQFGVRVFPTLFLLDEGGNILWRHEGGLRQDDVEVLRREIEGRLGMHR